MLFVDGDQFEDDFTFNLSILGPKSCQSRSPIDMNTLNMNKPMKKKKRQINSNSKNSKYSHPLLQERQEQIKSMINETYDKESQEKQKNGPYNTGIVIMQHCRRQALGVQIVKGLIEHCKLKIDNGNNWDIGNVCRFNCNVCRRYGHELLTNIFEIFSRVLKAVPQSLNSDNLTMKMIGGNMILINNNEFENRSDNENENVNATIKVCNENNDDNDDENENESKESKHDNNDDDETHSILSQYSHNYSIIFIIKLIDQLYAKTDTQAIAIIACILRQSQYFSILLDNR